MSRVARALVAGVALALVGLLAACTTTVLGRVDPALFGTIAPSGPRAPGAAVLRMPEADRARVGGCELPDPGGAADLRLPVGPLVETAARQALLAEFSAADATGALGASPPWTVEVVASDIVFDCRNDLVYFVPLGPLTFGRRDVSTRLALQVRVSDRRGQVRWSRSYDSGREFWRPRPPERLFGPVDKPTDGVQRLAHEQAYRLLRRVAHDVRAWVEYERTRERVL